MYYSMYFSGSISEETGADCFLNFGDTLPTRHHIQLVSVHYPQHLFPHVLCSAKASCLDKVLIAPRVGEFVVLPCIVDSKESEVVSLWLVELGLTLISNGLLVLQMQKYTHQIITKIFINTLRLKGKSQTRCWV